MSARGSKIKAMEKKIAFTKVFCPRCQRRLTVTMVGKSRRALDAPSMVDYDHCLMCEDAVSAMKDAEGNL